jgi:hypothetical protein
VPSIRFIFLSFFVLDHRPVASAYQTLADYQNLQTTTLPFTPTPAYRPLIHNLLSGRLSAFQRVSLIDLPGQGLTFLSKHSLLVQEVFSVCNLQEVINFATPLPRSTTTTPARERTACLFTANKHGARCQHK